MLYKISENLPVEDPHILAIDEAIAFAAVLSSWGKLQNAIEVDKSLELIGQSADFDAVLRSASFRACDWTCKFAADYIFRTYPHLFPGAYQAVGTQGRNRDFIIRDPRVEAHIYLLLASHDKFYAFSPNNYATPQPEMIQRYVINRTPPNPYDSIFIAQTATEIISDLKANEGGNWSLGNVSYYVLGGEMNIPRFSIDKTFTPEEVFEAEQRIPTMQQYLHNLIISGRP